MRTALFGSSSSSSGLSSLPDHGTSTASANNNQRVKDMFNIGSAISSVVSKLDDVTSKLGSLELRLRGVELQGTAAEVLSPAKGSGSSSSSSSGGGISLAPLPAAAFAPSARGTAAGEVPWGGVHG